MSFTARTQPVSARAQSLASHAHSLASRTHATLAGMNQGDGVRTARPTRSERRQLFAILGATIAFVVVVLGLGLLGIMAR